MAGCGKSTESRRADASQCSAYIQFVTRAYVGVMAGGAFAKAVNAASIGHKSGEGAKTSAAVQLGDQIARTLDPAMVSARAQDALSMWQRQVQANDVPGAVAYLDGCVENFDALVAAAH